MQLKSSRLSYLAILLCLLFYGCNKEEIPSLIESDEFGYLQLSLGIDITNESGRTEDVNTDSWNVIVYDAADAEVLNFADFTDVPAEIELASGDYTVFVSSEDESVGFDNPFYTGTSGVVTVVKGDVVPVTVNAELANVKVSVSYSAAVQADFTSMTTTVSSTSGSVVFVDSETRSGYFVAGEDLTISADLTFTKADLSTEVRNVTGNITGTTAKDHYLITVDYSLENGDIGAIGISVDESTNDIPVTISQSPPFSKTYGGTADERTHAVEVIDNGGYIFAGFAASANGDITNNIGGMDGWIVQTDNNGTIVWDNNYGGGAPDILYSIAKTNDGGYVAAGVTESTSIPSHHGSKDGWILKISATGVLEWQMAIGGTADDEFYDVIQTSDGGYAVMGETESSDGDISGFQGGVDYVFAKLDATGSLLSVSTYGGTGTDRGKGLRQTSDSGFIIGGWSNSTDGDITANKGSADFWALKINNSGAIQWDANYGSSSSDLLESIDVAADGNFFLAGLSNGGNLDVPGNNGNNDLFVIKIDETGSSIWAQNYGGSLDDRAQEVHGTVDGALVLVGTSNSSDGDVSGNNGDRDHWIIKLDASGALSWESSFGGSERDWGYSIKEISTGSFVFGGYVTESGDEKSSLYVVDQNGNL